MPNKKEILIVDDDEVLANFLSRLAINILAQSGLQDTYEVVELSGRRASLDAAEHIRRNSHNVKLMITDINMPMISGVNLTSYGTYFNGKILAMSSGNRPAKLPKDIEFQPKTDLMQASVFAPTLLRLLNAA